ncbi:Na+/H+ antiporter NhaA [Luteimonas sp. SDU82]|uniref:Na+/H+ antiporter NhaA n=1 Tax=Luteimonas sp. SDU82 TaxID=3422592 RepID=UPI003EB89FE0
MSDGLERLPHMPVDRLSRVLGRFLRIEALAAALLLLCAAIAIALSNSRWGTAYMAFWETPLSLGWGHAEYTRSLKHWIDDAAMTLFFFVVALELKRELVLGELRSPRRTAFALSAALGGMLVPALIFVAIEWDQQARHGWGIVMATDTAFVIGCLAVLGRRIPAALRLFLLSVAIFDDVGAIMVIAIGYGDAIDWAALAGAALVLAAIALMGRIGLRPVPLYIAFGMLLWWLLDQSGIHPTLAGVLLGLMTPARSWVSGRRLHAILAKVTAYPQGASWSGDTTGRRDLQRAGVAAREALSPLERLELALHPWVAFLVLPAFALANAGLPLSGTQVDWGLAVAVMLGLACGKPLGVMAFSGAAVWLGIGTRPAGLSWPLLGGGALLTGIGFTMSLLIAELALAPAQVDSAKTGVVCASLLSAACGTAVLAWITSGRQPGKGAERAPG